MSYRTVHVNGLTWRVPDHARARAELAFVLIHGAAGSSRHWSWVMRALPPWIAPLAVDLPGHGDSAGEVASTLHAAAPLVQEGIAELCGGGAVVIAGHSVGGLVALQLAITAPARVSHLALIATAASITPHPALLHQLRHEPDEEFLRAGFSAGVPEDRVRMVISDVGRTRLGPVASDFMGIGGCDLGPELPRVAAATVVMIARGDPVVSPRKSRALAAGIAGARTVVLAGGHYLTIERPADVAAQLVQLARERPAGAGPAARLARTRPVNSEPVNSEPVNSEPVNSEPVNSEPVNSEPAVSGPPVSRPADSEPIAAWPQPARNGGRL